MPLNRRNFRGNMSPNAACKLRRTQTSPNVPWAAKLDLLLKICHEHHLTRIGSEVREHPTGCPTVARLDSDSGREEGRPPNSNLAVTPSVLLRSTRSQNLLGAMDQEHTMPGSATFFELWAWVRDLYRVLAAAVGGPERKVDGSETCC